MFWTYSQNNTGGRFVGPAMYVIIEANTWEEANERAESVAGIYFHGCEQGYDCPCCGDRWYEQSGWDKGTEIPTVYGKPVSDSMKDSSRMQWVKTDKIPYAEVFPRGGKSKVYGGPKQSKEKAMKEAKAAPKQSKAQADAYVLGLLAKVEDDLGFPAKERVTKRVKGTVVRNEKRVTAKKTTKGAGK